MIGQECDFNGIVSPYTYVVIERSIVFQSDAMGMYKNIMRANPQNMLKLRNEATNKIRTMQSLVSAKREAG